MITKQFVLAGKALFTIEVPPMPVKDGVVHNPHYTYRVTHKAASAQYPETWFVSLLTGPDNTSDYSYLGMLNAFTGEVTLTKASKYHKDTFVVKLIQRTLARVWVNEQAAIEAAGFKLHHEGKCCRCGRLLTVPESVESGIGPECAKKMVA